jgi:hypothetical protein
MTVVAGDENDRSTAVLRAVGLRPGYYDGIAKPIASAERPKPSDLAQLGAAE